MWQSQFRNLTMEIEDLSDRVRSCTPKARMGGRWLSPVDLMG